MALVPPYIDSASELFEAISNGDYNRVFRLVNSNVDVNETLKFGNTPLCRAAAFGHLEIIKLLIDKGADVNKIGKRGTLEVTALYNAAERGHSEIVQILIDNEADVSLPTKCKEHEVSPLCIAASSGHSQVVKILLENGAIANDLGKFENWPLLYAVIGGNLDVMKLLIDNGADVKKRMKLGSIEISIFGFAMCSDNLELMKLLIYNGIDANIPLMKAHDIEITPLSYAAIAGLTEIATHLIEIGADVNRKVKVPENLDISSYMDDLPNMEQNIPKDCILKDYNGASPLYGAAREGHFDVVRLLLDKGGDIQACNHFKNSPLYGASENGHVNIVRFLLDNGADINAANNDLETSLHRASENGHVNIVRLLLDNGADINAANNDLETPLHVTVNKDRDHQYLIEILLFRGADVEARDKDGITCWDKADNFGQLDIKECILKSSVMNAAKFGNVELLTSLLSVGRNVNTRDLFGRTPLFLAAMNGHLDAVRLLSDRGADIDAKDIDGVTPLFVSAQRKHESVVQLLIERGANRNDMNFAGVTPDYFIQVSRGADEKSNGYQEFLNEDTRSKSSLAEVAQEGATCIGSNSDTKLKDQITLMIEAYIKTDTKDSQPFSNKADLILEIQTILDNEIVEKNRTLEQLKAEHSLKLKKMDSETKQLHERMNESRNYIDSLSIQRETEREELAYKVTCLEAEKARLYAQIEQMEKDQQDELETMRQKSALDLNTMLDWILKEAEKANELKRENQNLRENNAINERFMEQLKNIKKATQTTISNFMCLWGPFTGTVSGPIDNMNVTNSSTGNSSNN